jgi:plasmid stability protein
MIVISLIAVYINSDGELVMPNLLIRNLDESTMAALKQRARENNRSQQEEAKGIIDSALNHETWSECMERLNREDGGIDFELPPRTQSRYPNGIFNEPCFS